MTWFSWQGQIKTKVLASQPALKAVSYWRFVSNQSLPYPTSFDPRAWSTHPLLGQSLGYPAVPTKTARPLLFLGTGLAWSRGSLGARRNPSGHVLTKSDRYWAQNGRSGATKYLNKDTAYKRDSSSPSLSRNCCLQDFNQYGGLCEQGEGKPVILFPDILCDVRPLFPATFTKLSLIKLGKPLSYVISFRMQ